MMEIAQEHVFQLVICADKEHTLEEVITYAEGTNPSGTENGWVNDKGSWVVNGKTYSSPSPCEENPNKRHWVLTV